MPSLPSPLGFPGSGRGSTSPPLAWHNTRPPEFHFLCCCIRKINSYHPVLCICFREQFFVLPGIVHMFQRTVFRTTRYCAYVSENSFLYTPVLCLCFQRTVSLVLCENSFHTTWYLLSAFSTPPHRFTYHDKVSTSGIVSYKVNFLFFSLDWFSIL